MSNSQCGNEREKILSNNTRSAAIEEAEEGGSNKAYAPEKFLNWVEGKYFSHPRKKYPGTPFFDLGSSDQQSVFEKWQADNSEKSYSDNIPDNRPSLDREISLEEFGKVSPGEVVWYDIRPNALFLVVKVHPRGSGRFTLDCVEVKLKRPEWRGMRRRFTSEIFENAPGRIYKVRGYGPEAEKIRRDRELEAIQKRKLDQFREILSSLPRAPEEGWSGFEVTTLGKRDRSKLRKILSEEGAMPRLLVSSPEDIVCRVKKEVPRAGRGDLLDFLHSLGDWVEELKEAPAVALEENKVMFQCLQGVLDRVQSEARRLNKVSRAERLEDIKVEKALEMELPVDSRGVMGGWDEEDVRLARRHVSTAHKALVAAITAGEDKGDILGGLIARIEKAGLPVGEGRRVKLAYLVLNALIRAGKTLQEGGDTGKKERSLALCSQAKALVRRLLIEHCVLKDKIKSRREKFTDRKDLYLGSSKKLEDMVDWTSDDLDKVVPSGVSPKKKEAICRKLKKISYQLLLEAVNRGHMLSAEEGATDLSDEPPKHPYVLFGYKAGKRPNHTEEDAGRTRDVLEARFEDVIPRCLPASAIDLANKYGLEGDEVRDFRTWVRSLAGSNPENIAHKITKKDRAAYLNTLQPLEQSIVGEMPWLDFIGLSSAMCQKEL